MGGGTLSLFAPEHPAHGWGNARGDGLERSVGSLGVAGVGAVLRTGAAIALVWVLVVFMVGLALAPHATLGKLLGSPTMFFSSFWKCG